MWQARHANQKHRGLDYVYCNQEPMSQRDWVNILHDDVIKWKHFPRYWPFVRGIHRSPMNSPHKGQWRGALVFSLICTWINGWVNNGEAGDLRRHRTHYSATVLSIWFRYAFYEYILLCYIGIMQIGIVHLTLIMFSLESFAIQAKNIYNSIIVISLFCDIWWHCINEAN